MEMVNELCQAVLRLRSEWQGQGGGGVKDRRRQGGEVMKDMSNRGRCRFKVRGGRRGEGRG